MCEVREEYVWGTCEKEEGRCLVDGIECSAAV